MWAVRWLAAMVLVTVMIGVAGAQPTSPSAETIAPPLPAEEQPEILTRGPVHEAFAKPVDLEPQAPIVAPVQPPANITEVPPADRPQGDQFVWVPGYWSWDADRNSFIWVSGCWRAAPPNTYWAPGYWTEVTGGWQWMPGFWRTDVAQSIQYLPTPPAEQDVQAPGLPPSDDVVWVPGCWHWRNGQYVLRPGYWLPVQPGWVWVPSHYIWTPRGYIFVRGHWDWSLDRRGVLFAPVYFPQSDNLPPDYAYSPTVVVDTGVLTDCLFVYVRYCHYYFGDYYDDGYLRLGIYPWFDCERVHTWYDPIYQYDRRRFHRRQPDWEERLHRDYDRRRADKDLRPPRTYHDLENRVSPRSASGREHAPLERPFRAYVDAKNAPLKFERMNDEARQKLTRETTDVRKFGEARTRWDAATARPGTGQPSAERRGGATPAVERREAVAPSTEVRQPSTPAAAERREAVISTRESRQQPAPEAGKPAPAATEKGQPSTPAAGRKQPQPAPGERPATASRRGAHEPPFVPPPAVEATQPEDVKIAAPPIVARPAPPSAAERRPPAQPDDEDRQPSDNRQRGNDAGQRRSR